MSTAIWVVLPGRRGVPVTCWVGTRDVAEHRTVLGTPLATESDLAPSINSVKVEKPAGELNWGPRDWLLRGAQKR